MRCVGVTSRGIRLPILKEGDDLAKEVVDSLLKASKNENFSFHNNDVVAITESIVARTQGNYCTIADIAADVKKKTGGETVGVIFPILSRNRFAIMLKGIALGVKKVVLMLSYPRDEVGNALIDEEEIYRTGINPYTDVLNLERFRELFGYPVHEFTGVDYIAYYSEIVKEAGAEVEIIFANQPEAILKYTDVVISADIHTRFVNKRKLKEKGAKVVLGLDDLMTASINGSGYNQKYGLLGANKSREDKVKLFPRDADNLIKDVQARLLKETGKHIEVMIYGDGAFKDPQGKIWELADPVVSPFHTEGLLGTPNELKLKYLADEAYKDLKGENLKEAITDEIRKKEKDLKGKMASEGTTPRQITDLLGSLSDLTSGSGDKGTPVVLIQGYFDNYADE